jgi:hypothetical protein
MAGNSIAFAPHDRSAWRAALIAADFAPNARDRSAR